MAGSDPPLPADAGRAKHCANLGAVGGRGDAVHLWPPGCHLDHPVQKRLVVGISAGLPSSTGFPQLPGEQLEPGADQVVDLSELGRASSPGGADGFGGDRGVGRCMREISGSNDGLGEGVVGTEAARVDRPAGQQGAERELLPVGLRR